jgi:hypothetical protein
MVDIFNGQNCANTCGRIKNRITNLKARTFRRHSAILLGYVAVGSINLESTIVDLD